MLILDKPTQERILNFTKYAQLVSQKFGVTVSFDGIKAETNGTNITLPKIEGMNEKEIDFLYCVLLHEIGHIKYSIFTKESFKALKTKAHFMICNALEDARIENILMQDYAGANGVFEKLYNEFVTDKRFWKKIFGFSSNDVDLFGGVITYIHYSLLRIKHKISYDIVLGSSIHQNVLHFVKENQIDLIIKSASLESWDAVLALGTKIYDIFFKSSPDKSESNNLTETDQVVSNAINHTLQQMEQDHLANTHKINKQAEKIKSLRSHLEQLHIKKDSLIDNLQNQQDDTADQTELLEEAQNFKRKIESREQKLQQMQESLTRKNDKIQETKVKLESLKLRPKSLKTEARIQKLEDKILNAQSKTSRQQENVGELNNTKNEFTNQLKTLPDHITSLSTEKIQRKIDENNTHSDELSSKIETELVEINQTQKDIRELQDQIKKIKENYSNTTSNVLKTLQDDLASVRVKVSAFPTLEKTPGWEDADLVQQEFDDHATNASGGVVVNGMTFSKTNQRDIITIINGIKDDLQSLNLVEHFKKQNNFNRLECFNDLSQINSSGNTEHNKALLSTRGHLPLTTLYDQVKYQLSSDGKDLLQIRKDKDQIISTLKNLFRYKLKIQKKNKFKGNQEEGLLDQRSLWKLATKTDENLYEITFPKFINNVVASIALDISGSMGGIFPNKKQ